MAAITNISCYKFAPLDELPALRERLLSLCRNSGLKGTILLSPEGINLFVAGRRESVDSLVAAIRNVNGLDTLQPKVSESDHQPFTRMLVRIKKEIIAFGVDGIDPARRPSPKLPAATLKQWLDEGRPVTLLDTRNDYEVKLGTFHGALDLGIDHFREFPQALEQLPDELKETPIVMFCTGGIRCEKAGPLMESAGFKNILQLDGGILKYFEECGGAHYRGECFVFDQRVGVDPALRETTSSQCYACQAPLTTEDRTDARYVAGESCPHCFVSPETKMRRSIATKQAIIEALADPLPGSIPDHIVRPVQVSAKFDGTSLADFLIAILPDDARISLETARVLDAEEAVADAARIVREDEIYRIFTPAPLEPPINPAIRIIYEDEAVFVIHKPAPLPGSPGGAFRRNTLQYFLSQAYAPQKPSPIRALPDDTAGLMVWARARRYKKPLESTLVQEGSRVAFTHPITREWMRFQS